MARIPYHTWIRVSAIPARFDSIYVDASGHIWLAFPTPVLWWLLLCADAAPRQMALFEVA